MFLPLLGAVVLGTVVIALLATSRRGVPLATATTRSAVLAAGRRASLWRGAGLLVGLLAAVAAAAIGELGRGLVLAPSILGLGVLLGVLAGEASIQGPSTGRRTAPLQRRRVRDHLPHRLSAAVGGATTALLLTLLTTTLLGSPDDAGRPGRALAYHCGTNSSGWRSAWAGSYYSLPLAFGVAAGLLVAAVGLRLVVLRPRLESPEGGDGVDELLRHRSAQTVVAAAGVAVTASLAGVAAPSAMFLLSTPCSPTWWRLAGSALLVLIPLSLGVFAWCAAVLLRPVVPAHMLADAQR